MANDMRKQRKRVSTSVIRGSQFRMQKEAEMEKQAPILFLIEAMVQRGIFKIKPAIGSLERVIEKPMYKEYKRHEYYPSSQYLAYQRLLKIRELRLKKANEIRKRDEVSLIKTTKK